MFHTHKEEGYILDALSPRPTVPLAYPLPKKIPPKIKCSKLRDKGGHQNQTLCHQVH